MPYFELVLLILARGETPPATPPAECRGARFSTEAHSYVCSFEGWNDEGTRYTPKWRWFTV